MAKTVRGLLAIKILKKDLPDEEAPANDCVFLWKRQYLIQVILVRELVPDESNFDDRVCT